MSYLTFVTNFDNYIFNENSQKQIIQIIFEKNKNASTVLLNHVGAGARKVENLVRFFPYFDSLLPNIRRAQKRYKKVQYIIGKYCKNIESIESTKVTTLESNVFCLKEYSETS